MNRRKFLRHGAWAAILGAAAFLSSYFLTRRTQEASGSSGRDRLPPDQAEVDTLLVLHYGAVPDINLDKWTFEVYGEVENLLKLTWNQFTKLPRAAAVSDFHCVTGWTKLDNRWEGVRFREIARLVKPTAKAKYATIECYAHRLFANVAYTTSLPLEDLMRDDVLFAYKLDRQPLTPSHGGPLRLVVPQKYGYKSAKWVKAVKFTEKQELGFWESSGYSNTADPWTNDRYG
jgi:DMSO/TMAO reductase YedYZ molybdopterin-dependent catalytic subunit